MAVAERRNTEFDRGLARDLADAFTASTGIGCRVLGEGGETLYTPGGERDECAFFRALPGEPPQCRDLHLRGMEQAERFGGRYIYSCGAGLSYFISPILVGGVICGALLGGPVLLMDSDDFLDDILAKRGVPEGGLRALRGFLAGLPQVEPARLHHLSAQLFTSAVCIGDSAHLLLRQQEDARQQRSIGEYVMQVKATGREADYPIQKEQELTDAITHGDKATASALLNEILGHIFFFTTDPAAIQTRVLELLVLLSRAAVYGGADCELIFETNHRYMQELRQLRTQEDVAQWLARVLGRFTDQVFDLVESKHKNVIGKAVSYMKLHCARPLTLVEVAGHVGYSTSHFSKVFKEEMGCGFRAYLNQLRVEKSKSLLLSGQASIAGVCEACGFEDQSYFCKVFKRFTGTTPDKFRKQRRRLDRGLEYGLK